MQTTLDNDLREVINSIPKRVGMIRIKGVNDKKYNEYLKSLPKDDKLVEIPNLPNRW